MSKPTIAQAEKLFQNFIKLNISQHSPDSQSLFKASLLFQKLLQIQENFLPSQGKGSKKKSIDTNDPFYQPFILNHQPAQLKEPSYNAGFIPKTLNSGKLDYGEVLASIRIGALLGKKAVSNKITNFEQSIFSNLKKFQPMEQMDLFEGLVSECPKPEKCKELYNLFGESMISVAQAIADSLEASDRMLQYLEWRQIYPSNCIDLIGAVSSLQIRRTQTLPKGWSVLIKLNENRELRPAVLKNLILLDSQELIAFLSEQQFQPLQIDMLQEGVQIKLNNFPEQPPERLQIGAVAVLAICTISPSLWTRLYLKSSKYEDPVWSILQRKMLNMLNHQQTITDLFKNIKFSTSHPAFKAALYGHLLKRLEQMPSLFEVAQIQLFLNERILELITLEEDVSWVVAPKFLPLLITLTQNPQFFKLYLPALQSVLPDLKQHSPKLYEDLFRTLLHSDVLLGHQECLPAILRPFSNDEVVLLLTEISKKEAIGCKWFMACLCWTWLDPARRTVKDQLLRVVNGTVRRREPGQFKRGLSKFWAILPASDRNKLITGIVEDLKQFEHLYLQ